MTCAPAEAFALRWDQVDFNRGQLDVARVKNSAPSVHPPATLLHHQNVQLARGEISEIDPGSHATLAGTVLPVGPRLGLSRRAKDVGPTLGDLLRVGAQRQEEGPRADRCGGQPWLRRSIPRQSID
jgi:hypothetical protein